MNAKRTIFLSWFATFIVSASLAFAAPHGGHSGGVQGGATQGGRSFAHGGPAMSHGFNHWNGHGNWHHYHHRYGRYYNYYYGYPFYPYWGWGWGWGYGYPYYGYYNPYAGFYYSYNPSGYDNGYAGASIVAQLQQRLAQGGYYRGNIDGIVGPATRRAIRAYQRDHGIPVDGRLTRQLLNQMDLG